MDQAAQSSTAMNEGCVDAALPAPWVEQKSGHPIHNDPLFLSNTKMPQSFFKRYMSHGNLIIVNQERYLGPQNRESRMILWTL